MYRIAQLIAFGLLFCCGLNPNPLLARQDDSPKTDEPRLDRLGDPLPQDALLRLGTKRFIHLGGGPSMITLSNDEKILFSMDENWLIAWETETGKQRWKSRQSFGGNIRIGAAGYGVRPMTIVPSSGKLVSSSARGELVFFDPETGKSEFIKSPTSQRWKSIDISPDSKRFAIGGSAGCWVCDSKGALIYKIANKPEKPLDGDFDSDDRLDFGGDYSYARFSPDGKFLALINSEKRETIQLFNAESGDSIREIPTGNKVVRFDFSPDSTQIVASERDSAARLYDTVTGETVWEFVIPPINNAESYTSDIDFRPDGKQIAVGAPIGSDYRIRLLNPKDGSETGSLKGCGWKPWPMQYTNDSKFLYGSGWSANIHKWDAETTEKQPLPGGAVRASSYCAMSGDDKHLAFTDSKGIHLVDIETGDIVKTFKAPAAERYGQLTFNHTGTQLALGYSTETDINIVVWDVETQEKVHFWNWNKGRDPHSSVEALAFSKDGNRIAAAVFRQSAAYVFDLGSDKQITKVKHRSVYGMDIDNDGSTLLTTGWDKAIRVWDCETGEETQSLVVNLPAENGRNPDTRAYGLKLSHDESFIATCDMTRKIRLFDRDLEPISVIDDPGWFSYGTIDISKNDLWFGVGTGDGARVFDIASGDQVFEADEHDDSIYTVEFGARDQSLISGGTDGVNYLWHIQSVKAKNQVPEAELFAALVGSDGEKAFAAFHQLLRSPESALPILRENLTPLAKKESDSEKIAKWKVALGSDKKEMKARAEQLLFQFGPAAYDELMQSLEPENLTEEKAKSIKSISQGLHFRYRRATILLAELDSPKVDELLNDLLKTSETKKWKLLVFEAKKHRRDYFRNAE
jgi:WD40 repeat protein